MKRFLSYLIILTLALPPARTAHAFAPAVAAPILITAAGAIPWGISALAGLVAGGVAVLGVKWKDASNNDVLEVQLNPKQPQTVPSGWTPGAQPYLAPVPPNTTGSVLNYGIAFCGVSGYSSPQLAATACNAAVGNPYLQPIYGTQAANGGCVVGGDCFTNGAVDNGVAPIYSYSVCPPGYSLQSNVCTLTNAPAVPYPSDGKAKRKVESGTQTADPRDPDTGLPPGVTSTPTVITVKSGTSTTTTTINPNGTVTVKAVVGNGNGTSTSTTITTAAPNAGAADGGTNATGVTEKVVTGEGDAATEETVAKLDCGGVPCATEGTQLANKALLQDMKDNGLKIKEDAPAWATQKSTAETGITTTTTAFTTHEGKFTTAQTSGIGALGVPGLSDFTAPGTHAQPGIPGIFVPPAACAPVVSTWGSRSISFDVCPVANFVKPILEWFLYGLAILYVYGAFWRRPQGNA